MSFYPSTISGYLARKLNAVKLSLSFAYVAREKHVAVFAFPFATHAVPLIRLVRHLAFASPDVKFTFFSSAACNSTLFPDGSDGDTIIPWNVADGLPEGYVSQGDINEPVKLFIKALPENFRAAVAEIGAKFTCLLTDAFYWFAADMAEEMGVPWIAVWTAGPRALYVHLDVTNIRWKMGFDAPAEQTLDFIPDFLAIRTVDLPLGIITGDPEDPIPSILNKLETYLPRANVVAMNVVGGLDVVVDKTLQSKLRKVLRIGPLALTCENRDDLDEHKCLEFLERHKPRSVAYISFGSTVTLPEAEASALIEALEEVKIPFLWSYRGDPNGIFPNGHVQRYEGNGDSKFVPWAPQQKVLQHPAVGVFVTHGGWNSLLESIIGGVPLICRAFFGDQSLNLRTMEAVWGIGIGVEGGRFTKEGVLKALERVFSGEDGRKMRENVLTRKEVALDALGAGGRSVEDMKALLDIIQQ